MSFSIDTSKIVLRPVKVTFFEMHEQKAAPVPLPNSHFELLSNPVSVNDYRNYYYAVGEKHFWLDRMVMPDEELFEKINASNVDIFILKVNNEAAGYIEFVKEEKFVEILYFGIMPAFIGKGLGKYFCSGSLQKHGVINPNGYN